MAGENNQLRDMAISHQIGVRRLSTGVVRGVANLLDKSETDLVAKIEKLDPASVSARYTRQRLDRLLKEIREVNKDVYKNVGSNLRNDLVDLAEYESRFQTKMMGTALQVAVENFALPTRQQLVAAVTDEPFQGRLLKEWVDGMEQGRFNRLRDAIRMGIAEGEGIDQIVDRVRGTAALNYKDGVLETSRRTAEATVRTAVNHTATQAHQLTYEENEDLVEGVRWVATLESRTCLVCGEYDGKVYGVNEGPRPPAHINCRCTIVPVVPGGGASDRVTYSKWLEEQPADVQEDALGATRARLYRRGDLKVSKFVDDGQTLTLDQLRAREGVAFTKAKVGEAIRPVSLSAAQADEASAATLLRQAAKEKAEKVAVKLTAEATEIEFEQLREYQNGASINGFLRDRESVGRPAFVKTIAEDALRSPQMSRQLDALDSVVKKGVLEADTVLYRGIDTRLMEVPLEVGSTFKDPAFAATSAKESIAKGFGELFEIRAPKGTNVIDVDLILGKQTRYHQDEYVLPRGLSYKVVERAGDRWILEVVKP